MSLAIFRNRNLASRVGNIETRFVRNVPWPTRKNSIAAKNNNSFAGGGGKKGDNRQDDVGRGGIDRNGIAAKKRALEFAERGKRPVENGEPFFDRRADLRGPRDPFADRAGHGGGRDSKRAER